VPQPPPLDEIAKVAHRGKDLEGKSAWYRANRRLSLRLSWLLLHTRVSANQISWLMLALAIAAGALAARDSSVAGLGAALLLYVSWLLDRVDGEIARVRGAESWSGVYLDWIYHRLAPMLAHVGFLYRLYERHPSGWTLAMLATGGVLLLLIKESSEVASNIYPRIKLAPPLATAAEPTPAASRAGGWFDVVYGYLTCFGAAGLYASALAIEALLGVHALCWVVVACYFASLALATLSVLRHGSGGIDAAISRVRQERQL
jgi:hypothetical protein